MNMPLETFRTPYSQMACRDARAAGASGVPRNSHRASLPASEQTDARRSLASLTGVER